MNAGFGIERVTSRRRHRGGLVAIVVAFLVGVCLGLLLAASSGCSPNRPILEVDALRAAGEVPPYARVMAAVWNWNEGRHVEGLHLVAWGYAGTRYTACGAPDSGLYPTPAGCVLPVDVRLDGVPGVYVYGLRISDGLLVPLWLEGMGTETGRGWIKAWPDRVENPDPPIVIPFEEEPPR